MDEIEDKIEFLGNNIYESLFEVCVVYLQDNYSILLRNCNVLDFSTNFSNGSYVIFTIRGISDEAFQTNNVSESSYIKIRDDCVSISVLDFNYTDNTPVISYTNINGENFNISSDIAHRRIEFEINFVLSEEYSKTNNKKIRKIVKKRIKNRWEILDIDD